MLETEENIRNLIYEVMNQTYGLNWEYDEYIGFNKNEVEEFEKRKMTKELSARNVNSTRPDAFGLT